MNYRKDLGKTHIEDGPVDLSKLPQKKGSNIGPNGISLYADCGCNSCDCEKSTAGLPITAKVKRR